MSNVSPKVVAVVVAYNRQELLVEALEALAAQTRPLDAVVVIDNASSDGSADVARTTLASADVVTLSRNTGGAGGFAVGMARALDSHAADLVWIMDDDTVPTPGALEALLAARAASPLPLSILASRVIWTDGRDHPMNTPRRRLFGRGNAFGSDSAVGGFSVRSASFVSLMVDAAAIRRSGLPIADYFIWNDDFEYSTRLLRSAVGVFVPASIVVHKTRQLGSTDVDPGARFYYEVRNKVWMFRLSRSLAPWEKIVYGASSLRRWARTFRGSRDRSVLRSALRSGWRDGWSSSPRTNVDALADIGDAAVSVARVDVGIARASAP